MNYAFPINPPSDLKIVYIREVAVADLPQELRDTAGGLETVFSVHRENGEQFALVANRVMAEQLARDHDFAPVSVH